MLIYVGWKIKGLYDTYWEIASLAEMGGLSGEQGGIASFMKELFKGEEGNDDGVDPTTELVISWISSNELLQWKYLMNKIRSLY